MRNLLGIVFILTQTKSEIFKSKLVYLQQERMLRGAYHRIFFTPKEDGIGRQFT